MEERSERATENQFSVTYASCWLQEVQCVVSVRFFFAACELANGPKYEPHHTKHYFEDLSINPIHPAVAAHLPKLIQLVNLLDPN
jgi:hypothetical protein